MAMMQETNSSIKKLTFAERARIRGAAGLLRYVEAEEVFSEVPDECTLAVNISGCPCRCPGCHSQWLWKDEGELLDEDAVDSLLKAHPLATCIAFMGGDADPDGIAELCGHVKSEHPGVKTCWYSGRERDDDARALPWLDYYKCGPWIEAFGPLEAATTNQRMYRVSEGGKMLEDITERFRKKKI